MLACISVEHGLNKIATNLMGLPSSAEVPDGFKQEIKLVYAAAKDIKEGQLLVGPVSA